jgi:uncharacterized protein (DUF58 family)
MRVQRWQFAISFTFGLVAAGIALSEPLLLVGGIIPLTYVGYGNLSRPQNPTLSFNRVVSTEAPAPGSEVEVTLTVSNDGAEIVGDVRVVDGVPGPLPVSDGSPRRSVTLLPGETATIKYSLNARRGVYRFGDVRYRARSIPGGHVETSLQSATGATRLQCLQFIDEFPIPMQTRQYVGTSSAKTGGEGVEFFGSRDYQPGDPVNRIDWKRLARTGEVMTLTYREERARTIVFLLDASDHAHTSGGEGTYTGVELAAYAIERSAYSLLTENDSVGLGVFGTTRDDRPTFVPPGGSETTLKRIRYVLAGIAPFVEDALTDEAETADSTKSTRTPWAASTGGTTAHTRSARGVRPRTGTSPVTTREILAQTPRDTHYIFVTPLLDDGPLQTLEAFVRQDRTITLLSPDVIRGDSIGVRLERVDRDRRIREAQARGVGVIDWDAEEPLIQALLRGSAHRQRGNMKTVDNSESDGLDDAEHDNERVAPHA